MVKVFKCHRFKSQSVVQVNGEPITFHSFKDKLFVATVQCTIEAFSLGVPVKRISCFSTESTVHCILYSFPGNYVATVESKQSRKKLFYSVKVYLNWEIGTDNGKQKTSVRLAGQPVKPSNVEETYIQVIDLPYPAKVESINVCQKTGNLITVCKETTYIYHLVEKTVLNSDKTYIDVVLFLQLEWHIGSISKTVLCEDFIGVLSDKEIQVVKVVYSEENVGQSQVTTISKDNERASTSGRGFGSQYRKTSSAFSNISYSSSKSSLSLPDTPQFSRIGCRSSTNASPSMLTLKSYESYNTIKEDDHLVTINLDDLKLNQGQRGVKTIHLRNLQHSLKERYLEPLTTDLRGAGHQTAGEVTITTVFHQKQTNDDWKHIELIPTYVSNVSKFTGKVLSGSVPLRSVMYSSLVGVCCFVSSDSNGFLFDIWSLTPSKISVYSYSDIPQQMVMNQDLLYVLTDRGLEIFTSRCGTTALHHTDRFNTKEKALPSPDMDTCLCGIHPFVSTVRLDVTEDFVIILSKADATPRSDEGSWCLYAIEKYGPAELYRDMVRYGEKSRRTNEATYLNLILEGHMILRNTFIGSEINDPEVQEVFRESCLLIGEYYSKLKTRDGQLCIPYLQMSGMNVSDIIRHLVGENSKVESQEYGQGLIEYLKFVLLQDAEPFELIEAEGDMILSVCRYAVPDKLSEIILFSRVKEYTTDLALSLLQTWIQELASHGDKSSTTDKSALAYLHLKLCDPGTAEGHLTNIAKNDLIMLCVEHHQILHDSFQQLSPLSQLMRRCCPSVLTESLVILHDKGTVSLDLGVQLLQGSNSCEELYKNTHVKEYLELLLNDKDPDDKISIKPWVPKPPIVHPVTITCQIHSKNQDNKRRYIFEEAVIILSEIYIKRISDQKNILTKQRTAPKSLQLPADEGHFGRRFTWLDYLPPFKGPVEMKQPCQHILRSSPSSARRLSAQIKQPVTSHSLCNCALCFEDLIKLQSLLCSTESRETFVNSVLTVLNKDPHMPGYDSILILVLLKTNKIKAADMVVEKYPDIVTEYSKSVISSDIEQRKIIVDSVYRALNEQIQTPDDREPLLLKALDELLELLAKTTEPDEFLQLLPDNGNFYHVLPYITMNLEQQKTQQLLQCIKEKGRQIHFITS